MGACHSHVFSIIGDQEVKFVKTEEIVKIPKEYRYVPLYRSNLLIMEIPKEYRYVPLYRSNLIIMECKCGKRITSHLIKYGENGVISLINKRY
jgi:hypothetical protein